MKPFTLLSTLLWLGLSPLHAATITVTTIADEDDGNLDPGSGAGTSLREAIKYSASGDHVEFDPALDGQVIILSFGELAIDKSLTIDASGLAGGISISGNNASCVFTVSGGTVEFKRLTIRNGLGYDGGGIALRQGTLVLSDSTVSGNVANIVGGGIFMDANTTLSLNNSTISGNSIMPGRGFNGVGGAAIYCGREATIDVTESTLANNECVNGGGGAVYAIQFATLTFTRSTVSGNSAPSGSGGIYLLIEDRDPPPSLTLEDCIVAGNSGSSSPDIGKFDASTVTALGNNLIGINATVETEFPEGPLAGAAAAPLDPSLAPLENYGGPTHTMPPLAGSTALDAAGSSTPGTDQRGFTRPVGAASDLGSVESNFELVVTTPADAGAGSLRDLLAIAIPGSSLSFSPALDGETITLTTGDLIIEKNLLIDGTSLLRPVTISGNNSSGVFFIVSRLEIRGLTVSDGALGGIAVRSGGALIGVRSTISNNSGGGISSTFGSVTLRDSTVTGNSASFGAGISVSQGGLLMENCTVTDNRSESGTGAVLMDLTAGTIRHSTIAGNLAGTSPGGRFGAGVYVIGPQSATLENSIVADNFTEVPPGGDQLPADTWGDFTTVGANLIEASVGVITGPAPLTDDPRLGTLGFYGGPTQIVPLLPGSPAIDAGELTAQTPPLDQRGVARPIGAANDLGAVEGIPLTEIAPADDAMILSLMPTLTWSGPAGLQYEVFLGADPGSLSSLGTQSSPFSLPTPLQPGTTYFWRIDSSLGGESVVGQVLSFATVPRVMVTIATDENDPGLGQGTGNSLREVIGLSAPGTIITFDPILSGHTITLGLGELLIDKNLVIDGTSLPNSIIVSGNDATRVFAIAGGSTVEMHGLIVSNGNDSGILNEGTLTLTRSTISQNTANDVGGGIQNLGALLIHDSTIARNISEISGGGINSSGSVSLINTTVAQNSGWEGGGIRSDSGTLTVTGCTVSANTATSQGGGIWSADQFTLTDSLIAGNRSAEFNDLSGEVTDNRGGNLVGDGTGLTGLVDGENHDQAGTRSEPLDPRLAPLGRYGGPTETMALLVGSPAIDAGNPTLHPDLTDQRGFPRVVGGGKDVGAFEAGPLTLVENANNDGSGSLREAIANATAPGARILFNLSSSDNLITLTSGELALLNQTLFLDASRLVDAAGNVAPSAPTGVTLSAAGNSRIFSVPVGSILGLHTVTVTDGSSAGSGGGLDSDGTVTMVDSTVAGNVASSQGGGIANRGTLVAINSTVSGNTASTSGGGLHNSGNATILTSTFTGNETTSSGADLGGGAINNASALVMHNTTVSGNLSAGADGGGGIRNRGTLTVQNSIVAKNTATADPGDDLVTGGPSPLVWLRSCGGNLIGNNSRVAALFPAGLPNGNDDRVGTDPLPLDPLLADLADNGGPTKTMALEPGSPAVNAGLSSRLATLTDQRGFARILAGAPDIGAYESGALLTPSGLTLHARGPAGSALGMRFEIFRKSETVAGNGTAGAANGASGAAQFSYPSDVAEDSHANLFVADSGNNMIRMVAFDGTVSTVAGTGAFGLNNGDGEEATFAFPSGIAVGSDDNVYVTDTFNHVIRKLTRPPLQGLPWTVSTVAGFGIAGFMNGVGDETLFNHPHGITLDEGGNIYVADTFNHQIRKIDQNGVVSTYAGTGSTGALDGSRLLAEFSSPLGVDLDADGNLFVTDTRNHRIRRIDADNGSVTTVAGSDAGFRDGIGSQARFRDPAGIAVAAGNILFVADTGNRLIRKIVADPPTPSWKVSTVASTGTNGFGTGSASGDPFNNSTGLHVATSGEVVIADELNHRLLRLLESISLEAIPEPPDLYGGNFSATVDVTGLGLVPGTTYFFRWVAGERTQMFGQSFSLPQLGPSVVTNPATNVTRSVATINATVNPNGSATTVSFDYSTDPDLEGPWEVGTRTDGLADPEGLAIDAAGNLYLADRDAHKIIKIDPTGAQSDFAGSGTPGFANGIGAAAQFDHPADVAIDADGNLYVADELSHRIRMITPTGEVTTIAGSGIAGYADDPIATNGQLLFPCGVAVDAAGKVYIADRGNHRIRVLAGNALTTLAGNGTAGFADGPAAEAQFNHPSGVAVDSLGNVSVADRDNHRVRVVTISEQVVTVAGTGAAGFLDGPAAAAQLASPTGVAVDSIGNVYVADRDNHRLRLLDNSGVLSTLAGSGAEEIVDSPDLSTFLYPATAAAFTSPNRVAVGSDGTIFLTEQGSQRVRVMERSPLPSITLTPTSDSRGNLDLETPISEALLRDTTYYFRARAENGEGAVEGQILSFTTLASQEVGVFAGIGSEAVPLTHAQSEAVDFGVTPRGVPVTREFTITNLGEWYLIIYDINAPTGFLLSNGPAAIVPGDSHTFEITLMAVAGGTFNGNVEILSDDPEQGSFTFPLTGTVLAPPTVATLDAEDFGPNSATLNATINPEESDTTVWFESSLDSDLDGVVVSTVAGSMSGYAEGPGASARFDKPWGLATDADGNIYVADTRNHRVRRIAPDGTSSTIAGTGVAGFADGPGASAQFNEPVGVVVAADGTLFVSDSMNHRIRAISPDGEVSTHSGLGVAGFTDGVGVAAQFSRPWGLAIDNVGTLYVADRGNHRIRTMASDGTTTTLAGTGAAGFQNGPGHTAQFDRPQGIAITTTGIVYATEAGAHRIRRMEADGTVSTLAGAAAAGYHNASGNAARFSSPIGLAVGDAGRIYVADSGNHRIRQITPGGAVTTFAGSGLPGSADGVGEVAEFDSPLSIAAIGDDGLVVGELTHSTIRRIASSTVVVEVATDLNGAADVDVSLPLTSLDPTATYYFRAVATNGGGTTAGDILSFSLASGPEDFQTWQAAQFGPDAGNPLIADPLANPSGDGVVNLLKYAFHLDPNVPSLDGLPVIDSTGGTLAITYTKVLAATDLAYVVECSTDLENWSSVGLTEQVLSDDGTTQQVLASAPTGGAPMKYIRVRVVLQQP